MREYCLKCLKSVKACLCFYTVKLPTKSHFCLLMHPMEAKKEKVGTGRMTHLSLPNSSIIVDTDFDNNPEFLALIQNEKYQAFLLYPGDEAVNISHSPLLLQQEKSPLIFILDGTWPCAKSMMRKTTLLHELPRISFSYDKTSAFAIKQQPAAYCLSTIESVAVVISELQKQNIEDPSLDTQSLHFQLLKLIDYQLKAASDESRRHYRKKDSSPYKFAVKRKYRDPDQKRNICFKGQEGNLL